MTLPTIHLIRHGQTEWSATGRHTGRTDIALTTQGEADAGRLAERLRPLIALPAFMSPLQRAARTAALAGFGHAQIDPDLQEWDYGEFEGMTTATIMVQHPGWELFRDGCPQGECGAVVARRVDRVIGRLRERGSDAVVFAHGHVLRVLAARWIGLPVDCGRLLALGTASVSQLGYYHNRDEPCIRLWNDTGHLTG